MSANKILAFTLGFPGIAALSAATPVSVVTFTLGRSAFARATLPLPLGGGHQRRVNHRGGGQVRLNRWRVASLTLARVDTSVLLTTVWRAWAWGRLSLGLTVGLLMELAWPLAYLFL